MNKTTLYTLHRSTRQLISAFYVFMSKCNPKAGRGIIGEILVFDRLISQYRKILLKDGNHIDFRGSSIKGHDIEMRIDSRLLKINAKGTTERDSKGFPRWVRQHARNYVNIIPQINGTVRIEVLKEYDPEFHYVFVDIGKWLDNKAPDFYVLSDKDAKQIFGNKYRKACDGIPARKNDSDDMWIEYKDIKRYKNNSLPLTGKGQ